jgi:hypothetical protein
MSLALATLSRLLSPLWVPGAPPQHPSHPRPAGLPASARTAHPLRVTRLAEAQLPRHLAGRMVISGSFDAVCRELERLEALGQDRPH